MTGSALAKAANRKGPPIRFMHIRHSFWRDVQASGSEGTILEQVIDSRGGITVAYRTDGKLVSLAIALCHDNDNFCRESGRRVASRRLRHKHYANLVETLQVPDGVRPRQTVLAAMKARLTGANVEVIKHGKRQIVIYEDIDA